MYENKSGKSHTTVLQSWIRICIWIRIHIVKYSWIWIRKK